MKAGDRIKLKTYTCGRETGEMVLSVEEFRHCLGVFESAAHREAGHFAPLCDLYKPGPESESRYIPNFGEYTTNMVPAWEMVAELEVRP